MESLQNGLCSREGIDPDGGLFQDHFPPIILVNFFPVDVVLSYFFQHHLREPIKQVFIKRIEK